MKLAEFDQKIDGKRQAAFVIIYALDGQPWLNYPDEKLGRTQMTVPTCLMINRSDGRIGFIGGKVEEGERLEQAVIREVQEEIGYEIKALLQPLVAHDLGSLTTHAFTLQLSYLELRQIQEKATGAEHFGSELTGVFLPHLIDYTGQIGKGGGVANLLAASMAPSVREELVHFLLAKTIISAPVLAEICAQGGFSLEQLLS